MSVLPARYSGEGAFLESVAFDPAFGSYTVPANYVARPRWVAGLYEDQGGANRARLALFVQTSPTADVILFPSISHDNTGGRINLWYSTEVRSAYFTSQDNTAAPFIWLWANPMPTINLYPGGSFGIDMFDCDNVIVPQMQVELYPQDTLAAAGGGTEDLYLLPGVG